MSGDPLFQKSLQDLIKGIRSNRKEQAAYISQCVAEIKNELRSTDTFLKAEAVRKLTYLQMIGYNVSWASFAIVEVMSQSRFAHKRVGYLAANQSFNDQTDVILLTTNLFKKEFATLSNNQYEIGLAVNCLANIATKDLARDCMTDLVQLMNHNRPYVRKKAVLAMYKCYIKFPQGLRLTFDKLKERLDDTESSVISTAVNVICELANKNPKNYLAMAPKFFKLLTSTSNNWMLIKVVKLLGSLVSEEPRLARKLLEPLATIIQNTGAKSLQYECINTVTEALPHTKREDGTESKNTPAVIKICSDYLRDFIEDSDQNLKYLGLCGLVKLMDSSPRSVVEHRELVLRCLNDDDVTIRSRALELLAGIVSRKSLVDLVHHLLEHVKHSEGSYRDEIIAKVLFMCSKQKFSFVTDFAWYITILLELAVMQGSKHGKEVADQLIEITLRVDTVRAYAVDSMLSMLLNDSLILGQARLTVLEVLKAAAWIIGEYSQIVSKIAGDFYEEEDEHGFWIEGPTGEDVRSQWRGKNAHVLVVDALLHPRATNLPPHVQNCYVQAAMKVFVRACSDCKLDQIAALVGLIRSRLGVFLQSINIEVQERASTFRHLLDELGVLSMSWQAEAEEVRAEEAKKSALKEFEDLLDFPVFTATSVAAVDETAAQAAVRKKKVLATVTNERFYAVNSKAQRRVPLPESLDLERPFNSAALNKILAVDVPGNLAISSFMLVAPNPVSEMLASVEESRIARSIIGAFDDNQDTNDPYSSTLRAEDNFRGAPGFHQQMKNADERLFYLGAGTGKGGSADAPLSKILADTFEERRTKKGKKDKEKRKKGAVAIDQSELMPAGASSDDEVLGPARRNKGGKKSSKSKKGGGEEGLDDMDLTTPLRADEVLSQPRHREVPVSYAAPSELTGPVTVDKAGRKKDKAKKDKKDKKAPKGKAGTDDLLGLGWGGAAPSADLDLLAGIGSSRPSAAERKEQFPSLDKAADKSSSGAAKKKKGKTQAWQPLVTFKGIDVYYLPTVSAAKTISVALRAVNGSSHTCSVKMSVGGNAKIRPVSTISASLGTNMLPGGECEDGSELIFGGDFASFQNTTVTAMAHFAVDGLVGPEQHSIAGTIKLPICITFTPHKVGEKDFAALVSKSSNRWGAASTKVAVSGKPKSALRAIAAFLQSHTVEAEATKAASLAAKTVGGGYVLCLLKASKDAPSVAIDIKCLCNDAGESQALAQAVSQALAGCTF